MSVREAAEAVGRALKTVPGLRPYTDVTAVVDPPAAVVGPPRLSFGKYGPEPTLARFPVAVVVARDERALERLWELVPVVVAALEGSQEASITVRPGEDQAVPVTWPAGTSTLPAYELSIEVDL